MGVTRLVAPGPLVAMQTPTRPVAWAYPVAAWPAPCSCRTRMCRSRFESKMGSYAGRIAPPGMPKTTSTSSSSRARTSHLAPVAGSGVTTCLSNLGWSSVSSGGLHQQPLQQKTPRAMHGGASARQRPGPSDHALRNYYDGSLHAATVANRSKHCQAERETAVSGLETGGDAVHVAEHAKGAGAPGGGGPPGDHGRRVEQPPRDGASGPAHLVGRGSGRGESGHLGEARILHESAQGGDDRPGVLRSDVREEGARRVADHRVARVERRTHRRVAGRLVV